MFSVKFVPNVFAFYDRTGIQNYLQNQASLGWHLEETGVWLWKFRRGEKKQVHYTVTYHGKIEPDDPAFDARMELFAAYCAHGGWELAADNARMQIFRSEAEDVTPIETDAMMEVENIHRAAKKSLLYPRVCNILSAVLLIAGFVMQLDTMPLFVLLSASTILYTISLLLLLLAPLTELIAYFSWYHKAKRTAAQEDRFLPTGGTRLHGGLRIALYLAAVSFLFSISLQVGLAILVGGAVALIGTLLVIKNDKRMRKEGYPLFEKRVYTVILSVIVMLSAVFIASLLTEFTDNGSQIPYAAPLHIHHLDGSPQEHRDFRCSVEEDVFVKQSIVICSPEEDSLVYHIVDVKAGIAYGLMLNYYLRMYEDPIYEKLADEGFDPTFRETDATAWGANAAYYLYNKKLGGNIYVLCYDSRILYISYTQEFTPERIETVKQLLELR